MKKIILICFVALLLGSASYKQSKGPRYTAYNIWNHRGELACINYKLGDRIIPAGTAVKGVKVVNKNNGWAIVFRIAETNEKIRVFFTPRWHPNQTAKSFKKKMFTRKKFERRTRHLNQKEIQSIKQGNVTMGMSKRAVLISYGPPPEHRTPTLDSNRWTYWMNRHRQKTICFDANERTARCSDLSNEEL